MNTHTRTPEQRQDIEDERRDRDNVNEEPAPEVEPAYDAHVGLPPSDAVVTLTKCGGHGAALGHHDEELEEDVQHEDAVDDAIGDPERVWARGRLEESH